jgi:hypothetical protein
MSTGTLDALIRNELAKILLQPEMAYRWIRPSTYNQVLQAKTGALPPNVSAAFSLTRWAKHGRECIAPAFVIVNGLERRVMLRARVAVKRIGFKKNTMSPKKVFCGSGRSCFV